MRSGENWRVYTANRRQYTFHSNPVGNLPPTAYLLGSIVECNMLGTKVQIESDVRSQQTACEDKVFDYDPATDSSIDIESMVKLCIAGQRFLLDECYFPEDKGAAIAAAI